ncbi:hypothetical protein RHMOL_Rhmol03G0093000 [Rhododendron molle]|uniref:Uncharacterized protein n=1 Tax=Rhododendron molle TaxID=49168 RepID=A0ACC0PEQ0_RHOML|nr:hypothetical protein RHMOL_Rhmol03G0093000 [Rhododendron molle]
MKMSSFVKAKILIATNIFKEIDEWIIVEVEDKSYKVKVMEDSCDQPHKAEKQIPKVSLASSVIQNDSIESPEYEFYYITHEQNYNKMKLQKLKCKPKYRLDS